MCIPRLHTYIHTYTHTHTYIHTNTHTHTHTYIYTYKHTYIQTYTYIYTYTQTHKSEQGVGAGITIIRPGTTTVELIYKMDTRCTNNQAEAFAILKALEYVQTNFENDVDKVTTLYTDSRTTLESLHNMNKHTFLTEEIRRKVQEMGSRGWTKAHVGTTGNERLTS